MFLCSKCKLSSTLESVTLDDKYGFRVAELCQSCYQEVSICLTHRPVELSRALEANSKQLIDDERKGYLSAHSYASLKAYYLDFGSKYIR